MPAAMLRDEEDEHGGSGRGRTAGRHHAAANPRLTLTVDGHKPFVRFDVVIDAAVFAALVRVGRLTPEAFSYPAADKSSSGVFHRFFHCKDFNAGGEGTVGSESAGAKSASRGKGIAAKSTLKCNNNNVTVHY